MARRIQEDDLQAVERVLRRRPDGMTALEISDALESAPPRRTLQYHLRRLVAGQRLVRDGGGRQTRYRVTREDSPDARATGGNPAAGVRVDVPLPLSPDGSDVLERVRRPLAEREPVGYNRAFLDAYRPNETAWLSAAERAQLHEAGRLHAAEQPAGTHARQVLNRLLIDLSWNSSRLEGNTYSLLDTRRLLDAGEQAEGKQRREAQMILNHKDAIEFLVDGASEVAFNRYTILNLHALLAGNLLADPEAEGRLRRIDVGIAGSVFQPLAAPQVVEECFDQMLATAAAIRDPFEQALFVMVQLPYLQPFDDVNKRVSRLAANIPLIKANLSPLSFEDVPRGLYTEAMLGVYELNRTELLRDVFIWACQRSAARYGAIRQSLGEPDPFRMRYRTMLRDVVGAVVRGRMNPRQAADHVGACTRERVEPQDRERFQEVAERELLSLHEGNFARYRIRPSEFAAWRQVWNERT